MKTTSSLCKLTIRVSLVNVLLVVVYADLKPTGNGMILVTALTILPFDIDAMAFPYYVLDKPYVEGSQVPASQSAVTPLTAVHATYHVRFNNVTTNSSIAALPLSNDNELIAPIREGTNTNSGSPHSGSISRSVIASIAIALLIFITSLIVLYLWRHYYPPPRKTRSQISQGSAGGYPVAGNHWSSTRSLSQ